MSRTAVIRANNGCTDTDNNSTDFAVVVPSPRYSSSPANFCNATSNAINSILSTPFCVAANSTKGTLQFTATGNFSNSIFKALLSDSNGSFAAPVTTGVHNYRLRAVKTSGNIIYITFITIGQMGPENLSILPNIITNKTLNKQATLPKGMYKTLVINSSG